MSGLGRSCIQRQLCSNRRLSFDAVACSPLRRATRHMTARRRSARWARREESGGCWASPTPDGFREQGFMGSEASVTIKTYITITNPYCPMLSGGYMTGLVLTLPPQKPMPFRARNRRYRCSSSWLARCLRPCRRQPSRRRSRVRADSAVTRYRTATVDGIDIFYREAGRGGCARGPPAARLSHLVAHVPQPDSGARASLPRDRARLSGVRS